MRGLRALCILAALAAAGCPAGGPGSVDAGAGGAARAAAPARVVSLAPSLTELCFAVGEGARVVGVTSHCDWPGAARAIAKVGGYNTPNVEAVLGLRPDLVLVPEEGALLGPVEQLRRLGIRVEPVKVETLADLLDACRRVGALLGAADEGEELAGALGARIARVREAVRGRAAPRVLLVVDHHPVFAAGRGSFADALLGAAGAVNALGDAGRAWTQLGAESLVAIDPDVVVDTSMVARDGDPWKALPRLRAIEDGRLVRIDPDLVVRPGPRLVDGLEALAKAIHSEGR